jgi:hypothetical protein
MRSQGAEGIGAYALELLLQALLAGASGLASGCACTCIASACASLAGCTCSSALWDRCQVSDAAPEEIGFWCPLRHLSVSTDDRCE